MGGAHDNTSYGQGGVEQLFVFPLVQADMRSWKHPTIRCQGNRVSLAVGLRGGIGHKPNCLLNSKDCPRRCCVKPGCRFLFSVLLN